MLVNVDLAFYFTLSLCDLSIINDWDTFTLCMRI